MKLEPNKTYVIDWEKAATLDDIKCILAALNFQFTTGHVLQANSTS